MLKGLLKIEGIKLLNYTSARVLLALHLGLFILVVFVMSQVNITAPGFSTTNLFRFPHIWQVTAWVASWFNLFLAILIIILTCNEYIFKTFRQSLIDGLIRRDLFIGKSAVIFLLAFYAVVLVVLVSVVMGIIHTRQFTFSDLIADIPVAGVYFIQAIAYMYLGFLFANIFRNTALAIVSFLVLRLILEPILRTFFDPFVRLFFPMKVITGLTPMPEFLSITSDTNYTTQDGENALDLSEIGLAGPEINTFATIMVALAYILMFAAASYFLLKKRDF